MYLLRKTGSPYWYAKFESPRGSKRYVSKSTGIAASERTRRQAIEEARAIQDRLDREYAAQAQGDGTAVIDVVDQFWTTEVQDLKSADSYLLYLERIVEHLGERRNYCNIETPDVAAFVDALVELGLSDGTINRHLSAWQRMHKVAGTKRGLPVRMIDWSECKRMEAAGRTRFIEIEDAQRLLLALPQRGQEILLFGLMTGCRKNQILSLTWDRVRLEDARICVFKKHRRKNVQHWIELNQDALQIIRRRYVQRTGDPNELVFDATNFRKDWAAALSLAGIDDFRFHDVRHTAATWMARVSRLEVVKEVLGHADITTTMRYAHVTQDDMRQAVDRMPRIGIAGVIEGKKKRIGK